MKTQEKWDRRFLAMAEHVAQWSKDPSTKTGAVIIRPDRTVASVGYNGFPRGVADDYRKLNNREVKYEITVHCEMNAILSAREPLEGYTLYCHPFNSCTRCAVHVIQAKIKRVVSLTPSEDLLSRWADSLQQTERLFAEAGVTYQEYPHVSN